MEKKKIDAKAEFRKSVKGLLNKYVKIPQNSGELSLRGIQEGFQLGKYFDFIDAGLDADNNRSLDYPTAVTVIEYDFDKLETYLAVGNINDPEEN